jgi:hypothetical protein
MGRGPFPSTALCNEVCAVHCPGPRPAQVEFSISENGVSGPAEDKLRPPAVLEDTFRLSYYT